MIACKNCNAKNPESSLYCQDCGSRMGDWEPREAGARMATPPTGLARPGGKTDHAPGRVTCPRCGSMNAPHMRFCNNCGYQLLDPPSGRTESRAAEAATNAEKAEGKGTVCWRCYGVGDAGADFCKFCGARYAEGKQAAAAAPPAPPVAAPIVAPPVAAPIVAPLAAAPSFTPSAPVPAPPRISSVPPPRPVSVPAPAPIADAPRKPALDQRQARGTLVSILKDGSDGKRYAIQDEVTDIGREEGHIVLTEDPYLSGRHARLTLKGDTATLRDLDSVNGVYVRLREPVDLANGDMILLGQQVLRFELLNEMELPLGPAMQHGVTIFGTPEVQRIARLVQYTTEGVGRDVHYLYRDETVVGREQGDIVFTDDPFMSRRHAAISIDRATRRFILKDLGSSNGTALRFQGQRTLRTGDQFRVGRHLFRFDDAADRGGGQNS